MTRISASLIFILAVFTLRPEAQSTVIIMPSIDPGVSLDLAKWRAAHYSDVRYKLNLTLEKMSPVLKGTIEIRVKVSETPASAGANTPGGKIPPIVLDWRRIRGHEDKSTISNVTINGWSVDTGVRPPFEEINEHLIFREGVKIGENAIKLDFTSPILTSGSAITRYVDKEDGSEYIYSLFVPSDASTAFPVFDQPDLKARFELEVIMPNTWTAVSNSFGYPDESEDEYFTPRKDQVLYYFQETKPISTYVFAFAAGNFEVIQAGYTPDELAQIRTHQESLANPPDLPGALPLPRNSIPYTLLSRPPENQVRILVRRSQAAKFKLHAAEVFRLNREAIKYFEEYFDYKFPFPKYDLVLIPEFPFGGMEHAGATFLRESAIIFPQEPTKNDHISRALLIFHEASHQWFGDTVTMRWFDDLWLKEGFATFTAYKAMEKIMPEMNAWKVFYERVKQAAYQTDSTKGTTPIYQEIKNLSAAKSAYGNIVYNKAPAFLRQAEFYLGEDKFQAAVRAFLKKHEYANANWQELLDELVEVDWLRSAQGGTLLSSTIQKEAEASYRNQLRRDLSSWITQRAMPVFRTTTSSHQLWDPTVRSLEEGIFGGWRSQSNILDESSRWTQKFKLMGAFSSRKTLIEVRVFEDEGSYGGRATHLVYSGEEREDQARPLFVFPNYRDYGYGIFLLDEKSREYVLKNIQNEKDPFLRSMMWGALWDSVREGELEPKIYIETAVKNLPAEQDETMAASIANRVGTALNYYVSDKTREQFAPQIEKIFSEKMRTSPTLGQRITFYRAFLNTASSANARQLLKDILALTFEIRDLKLKTKDKFDIVTRLLILGDPDAPRLLAELEKTETSDDAKRYAYAARAGIATAENKAKYWNDFVNNKEISESWIEAAFVPFTAIKHEKLTLPYLELALKELPNHKRNRKIFFVNGWLGAFIGGQRSEEALNIVNKFLADNPALDNDLRLKILENADIIERAVEIREKYKN